MTLGDRIVIMRDGFIQQIGTPQEVFAVPRDLCCYMFNLQGKEALLVGLAEEMHHIAIEGDVNLRAVAQVRPGDWGEYQ